MGKSTISIAIFNSKLLNYRRVTHLSVRVENSSDRVQPFDEHPQMGEIHRLEMHRRWRCFVFTIPGIFQEWWLTNSLCPIPYSHPGVEYGTFQNSSRTSGSSKNRYSIYIKTIIHTKHTLKFPRPTEAQCCGLAIQILNQKGYSAPATSAPNVQPYSFTSMATYWDNWAAGGFGTLGYSFNRVVRQLPSAFLPMANPTWVEEDWRPWDSLALGRKRPTSLAKIGSSVHLGVLL